LKRKTAKEVIAESFREVAERKNIDKITVKDITDNCGYSSATFYRQFRDKYDLIAWDYTRELERILSGVNGSKTEWQNTLRRAALFFQERKAYLSNLFLHTGGLESFTAYMEEVHYQNMKDIVEKASGNQPIDTLTEMYIRLYVLGTVRFVCEWVQGKYQATSEELAMVFEQTFPAPLYNYLW